MKTFFACFLFLAALALPAAGQSGFTRRDVLVGDPKVSYGSTEFTPDWKYLVWGEYAADGSDNMIMWHCEMNPDTGDMIPADGKGFRAFDSTGWGRASPGRDAQGVFYVGMNRAGQLVVARPTSATTGTVMVLPAPVDFKRRAIYATDLPQEPGAVGYVFWITNENVIGGPGDPRNSWVELRYLSLANPAVEIVLQHQTRPPVANAFAPLDIAFPRCLRGTARITSGVRDANGKVQVVEFDLAQPNPTPRSVTTDPVTKSDVFPWSIGGQDILMSGTDSTQGATQIYTRPVGGQFFTPAETIAPRVDTLTPPVFAQSNERIPFDGRAYTAFQVNSSSSAFFDTTFEETGEIWLATVRQSPQQQWRLSEDLDKAKFEDEPFVGRSKVWVFYSSCPRGSVLRSTIINLRRCDTPLALAATSTPSRLLNLSLRSVAGPGDQTLTAGFVIGGQTNKTVLVRAVGPSLAQFGVTGALADPQLKLFDGASRSIAENNDWGGSAALAATFTSVGAFGLPPGSRDAALLTSLAPGSYTAQVSGVNNSTGVALVEVYEVP